MSIKNIFVCLGTLYLIFTTATIFADPSTAYNRHTGIYLGGTLGAGLGAVKNQHGDVQGGFEGFGGSAFLGYQFNPYVGLEGNFIGIGAPYDLTFYMYGAALRGILPLGDRFSLYAKAGIGNLTVQLCDFIFNSGACVTENDLGALVGAGASVALTHALSLELDYSGMITSNHGVGGLYGILGLGLTVHFDS